MKSEVVFGFENAGWPALLVDTAGLVVRVNAAASKAFGPALQPGSARLAQIWSSENPVPADAFLEKWQRQPAASSALKFDVRGLHVSYTTVICILQHEGQSFFVFQLFPDLGGGFGASDPPPIEGTMQKNKLDVALQLARSVALDFNNALTGVLGHSSLLLMRAEPDHPWRKSLLEIERAAGKGAEIANSLRAFSQAEREVRPPNSGNLNLLLEQAVASLQATPEGTRVRWQLHLEPKLLSAKFDGPKVRQAFGRILENALQAVDQGGGITISTRNMDLALPMQDRDARLVPGAYVCTEIADTGCGIGTEVLPRIFEPFFTTKERAKHRGLGLAWAYGVITNQGGSIAVSSKTGIGTSVRIYLPAENRIVDRKHPVPVDLTGGETILLVDDEDVVLLMARTVLEAHGYKVITATSGQGAIRLISAPGFKADLLVTDQVMPGMSGTELAEVLKRATPGVPVLFISGATWPEGQGTNLPKPFTCLELLVRVRQALTAMGT